jgi:hypothetical protein
LLIQKIAGQEEVGIAAKSGNAARYQNFAG